MTPENSSCQSNPPNWTVPWGARTNHPLGTRMHTDLPWKNSDIMDAWLMLRTWEIMKTSLSENPQDTCQCLKKTSHIKVQNLCRINSVAAKDEKWRRGAQSSTRIHGFHLPSRKECREKTALKQIPLLPIELIHIETFLAAKKPKRCFFSESSNLKLSQSMKL